MDRFEARTSACVSGTPTMPEGKCVDWTGCGFPSGSKRTVVDRPDLVALVAVPAGSCCCSPTDGDFTVVETATCAKRGECLDADWCEPRGPTPDPPHTPVVPGVDRCVLIADHFEPWRKNPDWASEISPRAQLIADCKAQNWSVKLQDCLLAANSPLDLDGCVAFTPKK